MSLSQEGLPSEYEYNAEQSDARPSVSTDLWHVKIELDGFETSPFIMTEAVMIYPQNQVEIVDVVKEIPVCLTLKDSSDKNEVERLTRLAEDLREMLTRAMIEGAWWLHANDPRFAGDVDPFIGQLPKDSYGIKDLQNNTDVEVLNFGFFPLEEDQKMLLQIALQKMISELGVDFTRYVQRIVYRKNGTSNNHLFISWTSKTLFLPEFLLIPDTFSEAHDSMIETFHGAMLNHFTDSGDTPLELSGDLSIEDLFKEPMPSEERFIFTIEEPRVIGILVPSLISI